MRLFAMIGGVLAATVAVASGLSPSQPEAAKKARVVGFSQVGAESAWRTAESKSMKDEAEKRDITLRFSDAQGKQGAQLNAVRSFITQKVDAIILAPIVETGWEPVLKEAREAHIPVILVDRGIKTSDPDLYVTLIASDFVEEGRMAGEWLASKTSGNAKIVELQGTTGAAPAIDRQKGFAAAIAKHPGMQIVRTQDARFERAKGKEVMQSFLKALGKDGVTAVYAHNDDMALGAIQAIEEAGLKPGVDIVIVSIDAVKAAFEAMIEGKLNATVECNPLLGPAAFDAIERSLAGEKLPKFITQQDRLFEQQQAAEAIKTREY
jgi:galactofuranose transport system substrate-binding protein